MKRPEFTVKFTGLNEEEIEKETVKLAADMATAIIKHEKEFRAQTEYILNAVVEKMINKLCDQIIQNIDLQLENKCEQISKQIKPEVKRKKKR